MINKVIGRHKKENHQTKFKKEDNGFVTDPFNIANEFNDFFVNIGPKLAERIHSSGKDYFEYLKEPVQKSMFMKPIVEDEIIKITAKFDQTRVPGMMELLTLFLRELLRK